jgi:hypothetical protein
MTGLRIAETRKPKENAPATRPRSHPNSSISGGNSNENAVRAVTAIAIVMKAMPTINHP